MAIDRRNFIKLLGTSLILSACRTGHRSHWSGCEASTSTRPTVSAGYIAATARTGRPPKEWPAST